MTSGFLEHRMFFALNSILQIETVAKFEEEHKRTNSFPGITSFEGDWKSHVDALVAHEMAHVFDVASRYEPMTRFEHQRALSVSAQIEENQAS